MPSKADKIFERKVRKLLKAEKSTDKQVRKFQQKLLNLLIAQYTPLFKVDKNGFILDNTTNALLVDKIDAIFDKLNVAMTKDVLSVFVNGLLESVVLSGDYFTSLGFGEEVVKNVSKIKKTVENKLGITPKGRLKKDGYLYKLGRTEEARQRLKTYVISSLTGDKSFLDFQLGLRNLVIGNKRTKGVPTTGILERYFDQYAYDAFNQVDAAANNQFAKELQLEHFQYTGSLIATSRRFCEKRAGKVFTVKETKKWKDDPDLIDKKTKNSYNPLIDRGRYKCRHFIKYITKELYDLLKV